MRILLVCPYFPPENTIAAVRISKFAEYWAGAGHDVKVLSREAIYAGIAVPEHSMLRVIRVPDPLAGASRASARMATGQMPESARAAFSKRVKSAVKKLAWPDVFGLWAARAATASLGRDWHPDVVVASVGPFSTLLVAARMSRRHRAQLVVDYRDLLASSPYFTHGRVRRATDLWVERRITEGASLLSAVSQPMVEELQSHSKAPVVLVTNGFEPSDFAGLEYLPNDSVLRIAYCGMIYPGKRDPAALFRAVKLVREADPDAEIKIDFYGRNVSDALDAARAEGIDALVEYHGQVDHAESLRIQASADLLLLLLWNDPREAGVLSGKLFEYIGAGRPILMIGLETGAAAAVVRDNSLGLVSNDPLEIARYLRELVAQKRGSNRVEATNIEDASRFTRRAQSLAMLEAIEAGRPRRSV